MRRQGVVRGWGSRIQRKKETNETTKIVKRKKKDCDGIKETEKERVKVI
jgi:hypothetical protein